MSQWRKRILQSYPKFGAGVLSTPPWMMRVCKLAELVDDAEGTPRSSFMKAYPPSNWISAEVEPILAIVRDIASEQEMAVAAPLPTADGALSKSVVLNGETWQVCVFMAALGRDLDYEVNEMRRFGRALALLHTAFQRFSQISFRQIAVSEICRDTCHWLRNAGPEPSRLAPVIDQILPGLNLAVDTGSMTLGLCHGDASLQNAMLEGERITFFDFDEYAKGPLALDLAKSMLCLQNKPDGQAQWEALLDGYCSRRTLNDADLAAMPALALLSFIRIHFIRRVTAPCLTISGRPLIVGCSNGLISGAVEVFSAGRLGGSAIYDNVLYPSVRWRSDRKVTEIGSN